MTARLPESISGEFPRPESVADSVQRRAGRTAVTCICTADPCRCIAARLLNPPTAARASANTGRTDQ